MALSFLDSVSPIVSLIGQIYGQNASNRAISKNNVATPAEKQSQALYAALADPNSPLLKQLTESQRADNLSGFQQQITEMQLADRRAGALGRSPTFFNPERADEAVSYLTSRGIPKLNEAAQSQAMQRILAAAGGQANAMPAQQNRQMINMQQGVSNANYASAIPEQLLNLFRGNTQKQNPDIMRYN